MNADFEKILSELITISLRTKDYHWNYRGREFFYIHPMLDELHSDLNGYADTLAERGRVTGQHVSGKVEYSYSAGPTRFDDVVDELTDRLDSLSEKIRLSLGNYEDDLASQDVLIEIQRGVDKWVWMLNESIS